MKKFYYAMLADGAPWVKGPFDTMEEAKQSYDLPYNALYAYEGAGWDIDGNGATFFSINLENGVREEEEEYYFPSEYFSAGEELPDDYNKIGFVRPAPTYMQGREE